jgi:hypothetical protein
MLELFGQSVKVTEAMECVRGGDHRRLVLEARIDYVKRAMSPDDKFALCGRCGRAVSLKV